MSVSAVPLDRRTTCHLVWTGINSEGGGGPGQTPINNNAFHLDVNGEGKKFSKSETPTSANNVFDITVPASAWGGDHAIKTHAQWNAGTVVWYRCSMTKNGVTFIGKVGKQHISTGTVSVTTDKCFIDFPCA